MNRQPALKIESIDPVIWADISHNHQYNAFETAIFRVDIDLILPHLLQLYDLLNTEEKQRADRFLRDEDRYRSIISRGVLRLLLGRYLGLPAAEINIKRDENKKPCFEEADFPKISFNTSHSGKWILVSFNDLANGIDIELVNASFNYQNLLNITCNHAEQSYIQESRIPVASFFEIWTRKEALLKATGEGLTAELSLIPALNGQYQSPTDLISSNNSWRIFTFWVDENYLASSAIDYTKTHCSFFNFQL